MYYSLPSGAKPQIMRKLFLLFGLFSVTLMGFSQVVINEDFSSGQMPPSGWTIDAHASNWAVRQSANAGGQSPEAGMSWSPEFNGATRLISPEINLTGNSTVLLQFRQMIDHYGNSYQIGVATRSNGGTWTNAWTRTVTTSAAAEQISVPISDANVNSSTFQFCIFFSGNSYNINDWYLDDIVLTIPATLDAALTAINVPTYFTGSRDVTGKITNMGITTVNSFKLEWQVDDGDIHTDYIVGQSLGLGSVYNFTGTDPISLEAGIYDLKVWVTNVNGTTGSDDVPENDTLTKVLRIPTQTLPRKPFFEEFTSSTCAPCASFNNSVFNPFIAQHEEEIVLVKYQMSWPSPGDPYYTEEGGTRRAYYGVNAVPMLFVDGKNTATTSPGVNTAFNNSLLNPAFVQIEGHYTISGNEIAINADITAYTDVENATLHVVIFEGMTTQNTGNNGETSFHHVMMRLLPDGNGSQVVLESGLPYAINHVVDMTGTNVEEMEDLQVAIFLQDNVNKEIFQAAYATLAGALVDITPENFATEVLIDEPLYIEFSVPVRMIGGAEITGENVASLITLEEVEADGIPVPFTAEINAGKTLITVTPDENLQMNTHYLLLVDAVENSNGLASYDASSFFTTQSNVGVPVLDKSRIVIYPNPASDILNVSIPAVTGKTQLVQIFNSAGIFQPAVEVKDTGKGNFSINIRSLPAGIYLLKVNGSTGSASAAFVIKK